MRKIPLSLIIFKFFYIFGWYFKKQNEMTWQLRFANILDILEKSEEESIDFKYTKEQQTKYHPFTSLNNSRHYINNTNKGDFSVKTILKNLELSKPSLYLLEVSMFCSKEAYKTAELNESSYIFTLAQ